MTLAHAWAIVNRAEWVTDCSDGGRHRRGGKRLRDAPQSNYCIQLIKSGDVEGRLRLHSHYLSAALWSARFR